MGALFSLKPRAAGLDRELVRVDIRFDSTDPPGNEAARIAYIHNILTEAGFKTRILASEEARPNLVARPEGQSLALPLLMYGHVDVVTTEGAHHHPWWRQDQRHSQPGFS